MPSVAPQFTLRFYYFVAFGAVGLYLPYFPTWLRSRGFIGWQMSVIAALLPFCQLLSPTLVGLLADRWGLRGRMMTFCASVTALGLTSFAFFAGSLEQLPFLLALACMFSFTALRSPTIGLADVMAMEIAPNYGRVRLWGSLGFMTCALLGGQFLDPTHPIQLPVALASCLWLVTGVSLLLPKNSHLPPRPAWEDAKTLLRKTAYRRLLLTMVLIFSSFSAYDLVFTLRLRDLGADDSSIGRFWAFATCTEVLLLFFANRLLERFGPGRLLTVSCLVSMARWILIAQSESLPLLLAFQALHALSFGLMWVSAIGVLKREVGLYGTATAQGLYASAIAVGGTLGLLFWGTAYDATGSETVFLLSALVMAGAAASAGRLIRLATSRPRRTTEESMAEELADETMAEETMAEQPGR